MKTYKSSVGKKIDSKIGLGEFLLKLTSLSLSQLRDVAIKGGVWIQRKGKGKILRIRSLNEVVDPDDLIEVHFDPNVLKLPEITSLECRYEDLNYGVWIKPSGVVSQGSKASDHASLLRYVEKFKKKDVYLVHRLDRETSGLMIVAYHSKAAAVLSDLFQKNKITKAYEAIILGVLPLGHKETIQIPLDEKEATTHFEVVSSLNGQSTLLVTIETGRLHQIRRHLNLIGYPVIGDPKYGAHNKNKEGLKLVAKRLSFWDPWLMKEQVFHY
jgi:tRNA pseudouridine32 synthase/23S rRNA pseudouridine746 synthase